GLNIQTLEANWSADHGHTHSHGLQHLVLRTRSETKRRYDNTRLLIAGLQVFYETGYKDVLTGQRSYFFHRPLSGDNKTHLRIYFPDLRKYGPSKMQDGIHIRRVIHVTGK